MSRGWMICLVTLCFTAEIMAQAPNTATQNAGPRKLDTPQISEALTAVQTFVTNIGLSPSYSVTGDQVFSGQTLAAVTIVFSPDSQLRLVGTLGDRIDRYIIAQRIVVLPGGRNPPRITWGTVESERVPPPIGKAPSGGMSGSESGEGSPGAPGDAGNPGFPGRSAPNIYVFVARIEGGPILVDLPGQDGSKGGQGQSGGDGGPGRSGRPGYFSLAGCQRGGENGGNGGNGGDGGIGGTGGAGGNGGAIIVIGREGLVEQFSNNFAVNLLPGNPGPGGDGGVGGIGGPPGQGGGGRGNCSGGSPGNPGRNGKPGEIGRPGVAGESGLFAEAALTGQQMKNLGLSAK
jgi:hypothetical protein